MNGRLTYRRTPPRKTCADCGADVRRGPMTVADGKPMWGEQLDGGGWSYACRWTPGKAVGTAVSIDYHYVEGEEQRHFVVVEQEVAG